jgi:hypothetical protein
MPPVHDNCRTHEIGTGLSESVTYCKYTAIRIFAGALTIRDETPLKFETLLDTFSS